MSKKGISQIKGPSEIRLGETAYYEVSRIYDLDDKKKVDAARWKLYALDFKHHDNWRELTPKAGTPPKIGYRVPVIVTNQSLVGSELMLEAYIYEPEKRIPPGLRIKVLPGIEKKITRVDLFKVDDTPIKDDTVMKYGQTIKVKVYTQNMQNEMMKLSLYEDDAHGGGDSPKNKNNRVAYIKKPLNKKGFLVHEFKLNANFAKIANAMMDGSHDKLHEYYVVVETAEHKSVSKNVEVQNPDYVKVQTVSSGVDTKKTYGETLIEEVVITGKYKKQPGINPPVDTGNQVAKVAKPDEKEKKKEKVCECEARVRAFIRMLRFKEGTDDEVGYTTQYSGKQFSDFSTHPQKVITDSKGKHSSSAAGAYQIMTDTWKNLTGYYQGKDKHWHYSEKLDYSKKYNIKSFDQESQDKFCLVIMKHNYLQDRADSFYDPTYWKNKEKKIHDTVKEAKEKEWRKRFKGQQGDIVQMIIDNDIKRAALISSLCWASLPDSPYGQQSSAYTFAIVKAIYENYLRQELTETQTWNLHLKKGFLKEFGYGCCGEKVEEQPINPESKCLEDCSQCFEYADVIDNPKINNQSGNKNHNRYKKELRYNAKHPNGYYHTGTDILASVGTNVHSMMCGEIVHVRTDLPQNNYAKGYESPSSFGNTITIKSKDKDNKTVYHFYAHLSKVNVTVGQKVKHNEVIGLSGSTGNAMHVDTIYRHVHVEAGTSYRIYGGSDNKLKSMVSEDVNPENLMKTKFDNKGNAI
jgi:murein DD-endopeptidase MepM/ murein hydrolase activator NlpD